MKKNGEERRIRKEELICNKYTNVSVTTAYFSVPLNNSIPCPSVAVKKSQHLLYMFQISICSRI